MRVAGSREWKKRTELTVAKPKSSYTHDDADRLILLFARTEPRRSMASGIEQLDRKRAWSNNRFKPSHAEAGSAGFRPPVLRMPWLSRQRGIGQKALEYGSRRVRSA